MHVLIPLKMHSKNLDHWQQQSRANNLLPQVPSFQLTVSKHQRLCHELSREVYSQGQDRVTVGIHQRNQGQDRVFVQFAEEGKNHWKEHDWFLQHSCTYFHHHLYLHDVLLWHYCRVRGCWVYVELLHRCWKVCSVTYSVGLLIDVYLLLVQT